MNILPVVWEKANLKQKLLTLSYTTAFMTEENSFPVSIEKDLVAPPQDSHWATHKWAQPKVTHLQQLMREVFENPEKARAKGKVAARDVRKAFAPEIVARIVMNHVAIPENVDNMCAGSVSSQF